MFERITNLFKRVVKGNFACPICGYKVDQLILKILLGIWACDACYPVDDDLLVETLAERKGLVME